MKDDNEEKYCFIADSPLQVFNAVSYVFFHKRKKVEYDLFVNESNYGMQNIGTKIKDSGVFDKVYIYDDREIRLSHIKLIYAILFPKAAIVRMILFPNNQPLCNYDSIFISNMYYFPYLMYRAERKARLFYIEDGIGSYLNTDVLTKVSSKRKIIEFFSGGIREKKPEVLFVNNVEHCASQIANSIDQLFPIGNVDLKYNRIIRSIFPCENEDVYRQKRVLFLTQPNDNNCSNFEEVNESILEILSKNESDVLIRKHPRDIADNSFENVDQSGLWELICKNTITDDHVLIGSFSTAQLIPKLYYDKEPWIIFTINLYKEFCKPESKREIDRFLYKIQSVYSKPEKVFVVDNINEFKLALAQTG